MPSEPHPGEHLRRASDEPGQSTTSRGGRKARTRLRRGLFGYRGRDVESLLRRLTELHTTLSRSRARERSLAAQLAEIDADLVDARAELRAASEDLSAASSELAVLDGELADAATELVAAQAAVVAANEELDTSRRRMAELDELAAKRGSRARGSAWPGTVEPIRDEPRGATRPGIVTPTDAIQEPGSVASPPPPSDAPAPVAARFRVTPLSDYADLARFVRDLTAHDEVQSVVVESFAGDIAELTAQLTGPSTIEQVVAAVEQADGSSPAEPDRDGMEGSGGGLPGEDGMEHPAS